MIAKIKRYVALAALLATTLSAADLSSTIAVLVYNYAPIGSDLLERTEAEAASIYQHCGINIRWMNYLSSAGEAVRLPDYQLASGPPWLALRMLSRSMAERVRESHGSAGFAFSPADDSFGRIANVLPYEAEQLAKHRGIPVQIILAYVVTHELGHLLLGPGSHGTMGIMQYHWGRQELGNIARGSMMFTRAEAGRMRVNIQARVAEQKAKEGLLVVRR